MPLLEAGWGGPDGRVDPQALIANGPTLQVVVSHYVPDATPEDETTGPETRSKTVKALIDTGASHSCIDEAVAQELGLPVVDLQMVGGVAGARQHNVYMARVSLIGTQVEEYGRFTGVNLSESGQHQHVLLGRSFLRRTIMIYDGLRSTVTVASTR